MGYKSSRIITLTTDFGLKDPYVGVVKGVILSQFPEVSIVDLTHEIPPFDVLAGAWSLKISLPFFAPGSTHIAVVDPKVGTAQRRIALEMEDSIILAPDNGLTTPFIKDAKNAFVLDRAEFHRQPVSGTFHARDVFAPIAARLAWGTPLENLATRIDLNTLVQIEGLEPVSRDGIIDGMVVYVDRYGNLLTNIDCNVRSKIKEFRFGDQILSLASGSYDTIDDGTAQVVAGSHGHLEIAAKEASAQDLLKARNGDRIQITTI